MTYAQDRTHYRALPVRLLIEEARNSGHELAIALGERLEEYEHQEGTIDGLIEENADLHRMIQSLEEDNKYLNARLSLDQDEDY